MHLLGMILYFIGSCWLLNVCFSLMLCCTGPSGGKLFQKSFGQIKVQQGHCTLSPLSYLMSFFLFGFFVEFLSQPHQIHLFLPCSHFLFFFFFSYFLDL